MLTAEKASQRQQFTQFIYHIADSLKKSIHLTCSCVFLFLKRKNLFVVVKMVRKQIHGKVAFPMLYDKLLFTNRLKQQSAFKEATHVQTESIKNQTTKRVVFNPYNSSLWQLSY